MAITLSIQKTSGVISVLQSGQTYPKYYFGSKGTFQPSDDGTTILITLVNSENVTDQYSLPYGNLTVNGLTATSMAQAVSLLNSLQAFGT